MLAVIEHTGMAMRVDDAQLLLEAQARRRASAAMILKARRLCAESRDLIAMAVRNGLVRQPEGHRRLDDVPIG